jgi:hypothetical protein
MKGVLPAVTALFVAVAAEADVIIRYKTTPLDPPRDATTGVLTFGPDRLATRSSGGPERTIYRGDKQLMWSVNDEDRTYAEIDKTAAERLVNTTPPPAPPPFEAVKRTSDLKTINGFACTRYDVLVGGVKQTEIYAAPWGAGGLMQSDLRVFAEAEGFVTDVLNTMLRVSSPDSEPLISRLWKVNGVPVLIRDFVNGRPVQETQIESITRMDAAASTYLVPLGYTKQHPAADLENALRAED